MKIISENLCLMEFSQFRSEEEFTNFTEDWLFKNQSQFSKGELVALRWLIQFSKANPGVCHEKIATILAAIHKHYLQNGISRATFKRMTKKAKQLGLITVLETARPQNGSQDWNVYIFNRLWRDFS